VSNPVSHICVFTGRRAPLGAMTGKRLRCDRARCAKPAAGYGVFRWGAAALCAKHLDEDCGPEETP